MALRERALWKTIKPILTQAFLTYRIESSVTPGFPDLVLIHRKIANVYFVELKAWKHTAHIPSHGAMKTSQRNWHSDVRKVGANNFTFGIDGNDHYWLGQSDGVNPVKFTRVLDVQNLPTALVLRSREYGRE